MGNVAEYFDEKASTWAEMERCTKSSVQPAVARMAGVGSGTRVLDVGCGLGVMVPVYLELGAGSVLGADVSGSRFLEPDGTFPNHAANPEDKTAMAAILPLLSFGV